MTAIAADERIATPRAATEKAARSKRVSDLHARRTRLLEEGRSVLASPEVSASGYVEGIAIERAHDALKEVARIDAMLTDLETLTEG